MKQQAQLVIMDSQVPPDVKSKPLQGSFKPGQVWINEQEINPKHTLKSTQK